MIRRAGLSQDARLMKRLLFLSLLASTALADSLESHVCEHCAKHLLPQPLKLVAGRKYARDRRVDIEHVKLDVTPDFTKRTVAGTMTMTFRPIALPLEKLELDAVGLSLAKIDITGGTETGRHVAASGAATDQPCIYVYVYIRISLSL